MKRNQEKSLAISVLRWSHASVFAKNLYEVAIGAKLIECRNFQNGALTITEKVAGFLNASLVNKGSDRNAHLNTKDGIHTANMGSAYIAIVGVFAGLRIKEEGLILRPRMPKGWESYQFRYVYKESQLQCIVGQKECELTIMHGPAVAVWVHGKEVVVAEKVMIPLEAY